jgi:hypothetical protein
MKSTMVPATGARWLRNEMDRLLDRMWDGGESLTVLGDWVPRLDLTDTPATSKQERSIRVERAYGSFERSLRLPTPVDPGRVTASFKNGLLVIEMPKAPEAKGTTIPIKVS